MAGKWIGEDTEVSGGNATVRISGEYEIVEDRWIPSWFELDLAGIDRPDMHSRIEIRDGAPRLVELTFRSLPDQREIRQADLRAVEVGALVNDFVAAWVVFVDPEDTSSTQASLHGTDAYRSALRFVERQRTGPGLRDVTPKMLQRVAAIYRENIDHAPTQAVASAFGVKSRMASTYVQKARERGFLPPTIAGKKKA